jgi:hypothetical protein
MKQLWLPVITSLTRSINPIINSNPVFSHYHDIYITRSQSQSQSQSYTLQLTVSQSVSLGVEPNLGLLTRDNFFFFESHCPVTWGRPL